MIVFTNIASFIKKTFTRLVKFRRRINQAMRDRYTSWQLALIFVILTALLMSLQLFVPPYIGYSNDGSFDTVFADVGLTRIDPDDDDAYFDYYERIYLIRESAYQYNTTPLALRATVMTAIALDTFLTGDDRFDIRTLALLYCLMYLPAVFIITRFAIDRTETFSEGLVIGTLAILIFGDVSLISRFPSLYTQPLMLIGFLYMAGMLILLTEKNRSWPIVCLLGAILLLLSVNHYAGAGAFAVSAFLIILFTRRKGLMIRFLCVAGALCIGIMGFAALIAAERNTTLTRKYNAMTRGILLKSSQPEETLAEFGIDARYSVLTDTYADQNYPVVLVDAPALQTGFFDHYDTGLIVSYYIRHPISMISMMDIGIGASIETRPSYSGNYEKSVGMPPRAKSIFMAVWSSFKSRSMPRTIGLLIVLGVGIFFVYRMPRQKQQGARERRKATPMRVVMTTLILFGILHTATTVIYSGDAEIMREAFIVSVTNDLLFLLLISEVLHRLNLIQQEDTL